jgi:hypothetical protein
MNHKVHAEAQCIGGRPYNVMGTCYPACFDQTRSDDLLWSPCQPGLPFAKRLAGAPSRSRFGIAILSRAREQAVELDSRRLAISST